MTSWTAARQWAARNMGAFFLGTFVLTFVFWQISANSRFPAGQAGSRPASPRYVTDEAGNISGYFAPAQRMTAELKTDSPAAAVAEPGGRKVRRVAALALVVSKPGDSAEAIEHLAAQFGGYLAGSHRTATTDGSESATMSVMVPSARLDEFRAAVRHLALRVQDENVTSDDVTRQWIDTDARLRNLRSEEEQYRALLARADAVPDMMQVSAKLAEVRGEIEQTESEFRALQGQVEMARVDLNFYTEAQVRIASVAWHPWVRTRMAFRDCLQALANYGDAMISFFFALPPVLLWLATLFVLGSLAWRIVRWAYRRLFPAGQRALTPSA